MRKAVTGWLVIAACLVLLGAGTVIGGRLARRDALDASTIAKWRQYATEVEAGTRTPSAMQVTTLTELAISQNGYAASAMELLQFLGGGVTVLGLILGADLLRHRQRT